MKGKVVVRLLRNRSSTVLSRSSSYLGPSFSGCREEPALRFSRLRRQAGYCCPVAPQPEDVLREENDADASLADAPCGDQPARCVSRF